MPESFNRKALHFMKNLILIASILLLASSEAFATRLIEVSTLDKNCLVVHFADGEVRFRDDATGASAYTGHDYVAGDDTLLVFGEPLNLEAVAILSEWVILSKQDEAYGKKGKQPVAVHRKSKVTQTTESWEYALEHWIYLELPEELKQGTEYTLRIGAGTGTDSNEKAFRFDIFQNLSEAVHVNMIGYVPDGPVKSADLYAWMGDGGQRDYSPFEGNTVWVVDVASGAKHQAGTVSFWKKTGTGTEAEGRNLTGSDVWNADFSSFSSPGTYRLVIDGVGCSRDFEVRSDAYFEPFKTSTRGYYYMRIGEDRMDMVPVPRRPTFIPGKDPEGFTIYITDLHPFLPEWREHRGDTWDEPHFKPAVESMFWKRRLPGLPTNPNALGGHSDALDWDRHLAHVSNIYDMLLPYILTGGKIADDDLETGESGNGIPDIMDEARNEVDFWLTVRYGDAYGHGLTNPTQERTVMFQAGATTMAAWANAANCAIMAECFRISGDSGLVDYYAMEAVKAFRFAEKQENQQLDDRQEIGDAAMRGRDFRMMAAAFLYNVTGEEAWEEIMAAESVATDPTANIENRRRWVQTWGTAAYLFTPRERHYPELYENMKAAVRRQAMENNVKWMDERPSRRSSNNNYWQTPHNLQMVMLAHAISTDPVERSQMEKAMILEADWGLGRNPSNIVEMTGLGERCIVNCYTAGRNDGTPGLHPGHTPYNNLDPWGGTHNGSNPQWFVEKCYPQWNPGGWPHQEAHFNSRYSWANGEFTPRETMRGKMALYGYLYGIYNR
jgi:hypothetical protein